MPRAAIVVFSGLMALTLGPAAVGFPHDALETGGTIVFVEERYVAEGDPPTDIHVVNGDGTGHRNLTKSRAREYEPVWSPRAEKIAFDSTATHFPQTQIHLLSADGTGRRALTRRTPESNYSEMGTWSPDGRRIAYTSDITGPRGAQSLWSTWREAGAAA